MRISFARARVRASPRFVRSFSATTEYDLCVIGGGPGGYVGAIKAGQLGLKTICIERRGKLGGTCLNVGCIPSKALLHASALYHEAKVSFEKRGIKGSEHLSVDFDVMMKNKDKAVTKLTGGIEQLFKMNKVDYVKGHGKLTGSGTVSVALNDGGEQIIKAKNIMLANGSEVMSLPFAPLDETEIVSSTGALSLKKVPEKLVVIGGGVIGLELGSVYERLGSQVTVVEFLPTIGGVGIDVEVAKDMFRILKKQGLKFLMSTKVTGVDKQSGGGMKITTEPAAGGDATVLDADVTLVCVGRREFLDDSGVKDAGVEMDGRKIKVDEFFKTNLPNVFAIGDIINGPMLAHKAEDEGALVAEYIATGLKPHLDYGKVPSVVYTHPEVAWVGATEEQLKADGIKYKKGKFAFAANGRAIANGDTDGFVKVLACKETDKLLGVHIINALAGDLIGEACLAIEYGAAAEDLARVCMAHPTLSEVIKGAAQKATFGKAISG